MKVFFTPYYANNPYQKKIMEELNDIGINVMPSETGGKAFFNTIGLNEANVIHFHWFEAFIKASSSLKSLLKMSTFLIRLYFLKKNKKFIWTVHNLVNHENKNLILDKTFLFFFIKMMDCFCVHNNYAKKQLIKLHGVNPNKIKVIPHGNYANDYDTLKDDVSSFKSNIMGVDLNKKTFTFLGHIRPYKGVLDLIKAFKISNVKNSQLLICGRINSDKDLELIKKEISGVNNVVFKPGYVDSNHIEGYLKCSDVMIYPYKNILTSGALILGMSLKKTCLASNVGSMSEFLTKDFIFDDVEGLAILMKELESKSKEDLEFIGASNFLKIREHTWKNMAIQLKQIYLN